MSTELRQLKLPADLCAAAEKRFGEKFGNLEEFLEFVLRELLREEAARLDQAERQIIEERLRELGYV